MISVPSWLKTAAPVVAVFLFGLLCAWGGSSWTDSGWQTKWANRNAADQEAENARRKQATEAGNRLSAAQAMAAINYLNGVKDGKASADKTIAGYRATNLRLQKRFDGLQCISRSVSDPARAGSLSDAAGACGLSDADVEFLVRFAQRADDTARQLAAAQQIIRDWKAITDGKILPEN